MIENGTLLQDRYVIEKQIGAGGMGAVYLAVDRRFENYVAIKETFYTDDEFGDAFEREARLLNGLHHPVLPHVSDYFTDRHGHFLVMQHIEGEDLSAILKREGAFSLADVLRWTDNLLDALDYLHSQNPPIIHRDIKPQNLKITPRGEIILLDFGLAKLKSEDTSGVKSVFGYSRKYSPLEQIQGTGTDARSDIFSLGATAYHLLTGKPPVDVLARAAEIVVGNPDPLQLASEINREIPEGIAYILNSALALNPAARFVSAGAMRQALEHAANPEPSKKIDQLSQADAAVIPVENPVVVSPETEGFTALEAFTAESAPEVVEEIKTEKREPAVLKAEAAKGLRQPTAAIETATKIGNGRAERSKMSIAAVIALFVCLSLAAGYFINNAKSAGKDEPNSASWGAPDATSNAEENGAIIEAEAPAEPPVLETAEQARSEPVSIENAAERIEKEEPPVKPEDKKERTEKPQNEAAPKETRRTQPAPAARRTETPRRAEPRENETLPDIESIFTGRPTFEKDRNRRDRMTDEEINEIRRERRRQRRQRQNGRRFPF